MTDPYNLTNISATNSTLGMMQAINDLSGGLLGNGWSVVIFIIILLLGLKFTGDFRKALVGASAASVLLALPFLAMQILTIWLAILYAVLLVVGIILLQDKDIGA